MRTPGRRCPRGPGVQVRPDYDEQSASTQDIPVPHCASSWHFGDASPGVSQNPPGPQTIAVVQVQQSALVWQLARQNPSTQVWPVLQLAFDRQLGCGRSSGSHSPAEHMSCGPQSASMTQAPWQKPFTQVSPDGQSVLKTHVPPPVALGWQRPAMQASPVPQSAAELQAGWQRPLAQRPPTPHSLLKWQSGGAVGNG